MASPFYQRQVHFVRPPITWAVQRLILLNVAIFALQLVVDPIAQFFTEDALEPNAFFFYSLGFQPSAFLGGYVWQVLSYQFLHGGLLHLFLNMLWLFIFGPDVERTLGTRQFYRFYLFCGALGVLATLYGYFMYGVEGDTIVVGASGAVMGVLIAFAIVDPEREFFLFPLPFPVNARALVLIVIFMNVVMALGGDRGVSVATHFGGMLAGFIYMKLRPKLAQWQLARRKRRMQANSVDSDKRDMDNDKIADAVNNIFKFKDRE